MGTLFLICFTLGWSAAALFFDGQFARGIYKQREAVSYPTAIGTVTQSHIKRERGSKHIIYTPELSYVYHVGSQKFIGHEVRFSPDVNDASARHVVARYPEGSTVTVYYSPANPSEAILLPGFSATDLFMVLFLTPFNVLMIVLWPWPMEWIRGLFHPVAGGVKLIADGATTRVRLTPGAWVPAVAVAGALGFVSIFALGIPTGMRPSMPLVIATMVLVYGAAVAVYVWRRCVISSGVYDLVINKSVGKLTLPVAFERKVLTTIDIASVDYVWVEPAPHYPQRGNKYYTYAPTLYTPHNENSLPRLADWNSKRKADAFAKWLAKEIGRPVQLSNESKPTSLGESNTAPSH